MEVRQFDQYVIRVDGSGRVTLRNRKFLRKYSPVYAHPAPIDDVPKMSIKAKGSPTSLALGPSLPTNSFSKADSKPVQFNLPFVPHTTSVQPTEHTDLPVIPEKDALPSPTTHEHPTNSEKSPIPENDPTSHTDTKLPTTPKAPKVPRILSCLLPHNNPGLTEQSLTPAQPTNGTQTEPPIRRSTRNKALPTE